ncbi:Extracellular solute-binding protein, family 1 [Candidatus Promineifilum breve]|uniref:Extracellular solute-binding protein, family 1 n=1 Tax=Candidatus Promineifilum breve TaxID=1806508 RepID=A0A160T7B0_9CHLR|nr:sugar ABC transporter substrate-binding protein [Candidatus Promineifilum breve]CUS05852.1 Extracellular solute-binding protein, family 1 [Candidatus Promineifilum breve]
MRKLAVLFVCLLCLAACQSDPAPVSFMVFGDAAEFAAYEALVAAFEESQTGVDVTLTHIPSQGDYRTRLATDFAAGTPPDVSLLSYRRFGAFAAADQLEPLGAYLDDSDVIARDDFYPITLDSFTWGGELACIPQNISSLVVYYNRDLFTAAGVPEPADDWTWDDFLAAAQTLTLDLDGDGVTDQYGAGVEASLYRISPFVWQNGGRIVDDPANPSQLGLTREPSLVAFEWFVALQTEHGVVPNREAEASMDSETRFINGTTAMYLNSRRGTPTYRESAAFDWDVAPLPRGTQAAGVLHSDAYCLSAAAANKDAAWEFIEFANSPAGQTIVARSGRTVPSLIAVAESEAFLDPAVRPARSRVFLDTIPDLQMVPLLSTWAEIENTATEEIERAFFGDISAEEAAILARDRTEEYFTLALRP